MHVLGAGPRLDDQRAVDHVHAAGEAERPRRGGLQPHGGPLESGQGSAHGQVREDDPRRAVPGLLTVEDQLRGETLAQTDHVRAVPAPHPHRDPLHAAVQLRGPRPSRPEEEPAQRRQQHGGRTDHDKLADVHYRPLRSFPVPPCWFPGSRSPDSIPLGGNGIVAATSARAASPSASDLRTSLATQWRGGR